MGIKVFKICRKCGGSGFKIVRARPIEYKSCNKCQSRKGKIMASKTTIADVARMDSSEVRSRILKLQAQKDLSLEDTQMLETLTRRQAHIRAEISAKLEQFP